MRHFFYMTKQEIIDNIRQFNDAAEKLDRHDLGENDVVIVSLDGNLMGGNQEEVEALLKRLGSIVGFNRIVE